MKKNRKNHPFPGTGMLRLCPTNVMCFVLIVFASMCLCVNAGSAQSAPEEQRQRRGKMSEARRQRTEKRQGRSSVEETENVGLEEQRLHFRERISTMRQRSFDRLQEVLHVTDQEWPVVRPRLQRVFDLVRPPRSFERRQEPKTEVERQRQDLMTLLQDEKTKAARIKAQLTTLRAAQEQAKQDLIQAQKALRQILSMRQEAQLVVQGLLN